GEVGGPLLERRLRAPERLLVLKHVRTIADEVIEHSDDRPLVEPVRRLEDPDRLHLHDLGDLHLSRFTDPRPRCPHLPLLLWIVHKGPDEHVGVDGDHRPARLQIDSSIWARLTLRRALTSPKAARTSF